MSIFNEATIWRKDKLLVFLDNVKEQLQNSNDDDTFIFYLSSFEDYLSANYGEMIEVKRMLDPNKKELMSHIRDDLVASDTWEIKPERLSSQKIESWVYDGEPETISDLCCRGEVLFAPLGVMLNDFNEEWVKKNLHQLVESVEDLGLPEEHLYDDGVKEISWDYLNRGFSFSLDNGVVGWCNTDKI